MKSLTEFIVDNKVEQYLIEDAILSLQCYCNMSPHTYGVHHYDYNIIFESLGRFENCGHVARYVAETLVYKEIDHDEFILVNKEEKYDSYTIDVSKYKAFCDKIHIDVIKISDKENCFGSISKVKKDGQMYISLYLNNLYPSCIDELYGIILHESLHGYEEWNRLNNDKESLFNELSNDYHNAKKRIDVNYDPANMIVTMKYYFDSKERNAFFGNLYDDMKKVIMKVKPSINDFKIKEIKEEIKKIHPWQKYFEFEKFMLTINEYSDKVLEESYYSMMTDKKKISDDIKKDMERLRRDEPKVKYKFIKSASEIRKEVKAKWNVFNKKFNQLFVKIYGEIFQQEINENKTLCMIHRWTNIDPFDII